ncbi:MAG: hypothetical protein ACTSPN_16935 [Promethearchaeota archaeon]
MKRSWKIGEEARVLDEKSLKNRAKIGRKSINRIFGAFFFYSLVMILFFYIL